MASSRSVPRIDEDEILQSQSPFERRSTRNLNKASAYKDDSEASGLLRRRESSEEPQKRTSKNKKHAKQPANKGKGGLAATMTVAAKAAAKRQWVPQHAFPTTLHVIMHHAL
jgi:hypothetical protein